MREKNIHKLIEERNSEAKRRIWKKISSELNLSETPQPKPTVKQKTWRWAVVATALVCIVTLSIVLPLTLGNEGPKMRFCDNTQYETKILNQTIKEYSLSHNNEFLFVDWYDYAEETETSYGHITNDEKDILFFMETLVVLKEDGDEFLIFSVTDNKTRVDIFDIFYKDNFESTVVHGQSVRLYYTWDYTYATFEHQNHIYYLQLNVGDGKERLTEIIESMFK